MNDFLFFSIISLLFILKTKTKAKPIIDNTDCILAFELAYVGPLFTLYWVKYGPVPIFHIS